MGASSSCGSATRSFSFTFSSSSMAWMPLESKRSHLVQQRILSAQQNRHATVMRLTGSTLGLNANGHGDDVSANGSDSTNQPATRPVPPLAHDAIPPPMLFTAKLEATTGNHYRGTTLPSSEGSTLMTATSGRRPFHRPTIPTPFKCSIMPIAVHGTGISLL
ncbi:hypothetical protein BGW80DRAFT_1412432, partial [Lactifluus volemus]